MFTVKVSIHDREMFLKSKTNTSSNIIRKNWNPLCKLQSCVCIFSNFQTIPGDSQTPRPTPTWSSGSTFPIFSPGLTRPSSSVCRSIFFSTPPPSFSPKATFIGRLRWAWASFLQTTSCCCCAPPCSGKCLTTRTRRPCASWPETTWRSAGTWMRPHSAYTTPSLTSSTAGTPFVDRLRASILVKRVKTPLQPVVMMA